MHKNCLRDRPPLYLSLSIWGNKSRAGRKIFPCAKAIYLSYANSDVAPPPPILPGIGKGLAACGVAALRTKKEEGATPPRPNPYFELFFYISILL